ncbi:MAG TPA: hypothetical protein PLY94_08240, partial [Gemmatimonadaceae bacterium]|nr:hypothetical protein [Gemmatimonadaceae bacterium]
MGRASALIAVVLALAAGSRSTHAESLHASELSSATLLVASNDTLKACFVPTTGVVYLVGQPGLPTACVSPVHVALSWNARGPQGPQGEIGPQGPAGPAG